MKKLITVVWALSFATGLFAESVSPEEAMRAADKWCASNGHLAETAGVAVDAVPESDVDGAVLWHSVRMSSGTVLIVSPDTRVEPVLAVLKKELDADSPFRTLLRSDVRRRLKAAAASARTQASDKWGRLLGETSSGKRKFLSAAAAPGKSPATIIRHLPEFASGRLTYWRQFREQTPSNYSAGCVASIGAALLQYFGVTNAPHKTVQCSVDGVQVALETSGRDYDWSIMPADGGRGDLTESQLELASRVVSDVGVCLGSSYSKDGTTASLDALVGVLRDDYGFADARCLMPDSSGSFVQYASLVYAQVRAGAPVALGICDEASGNHVVLAVGYGEDADATAYTRLFMGWGGEDDAWFVLPDVTVSEDESYNVIECVLTMVGRTQETLPVYGRVMTDGNEPAAFEQVLVGGKVAMTDENGYWGLRLPAVSGNLVCRCGDGGTQVAVPASVGETHLWDELSQAIPGPVDFRIAEDGALRAFTSPQDALDRALAEGKALYLMLGSAMDERSQALKRELKALGRDFGDHFVLCSLNAEQEAYGFDDASAREYPVTGIFDPRKFSVEGAWKAGLLGRGTTSAERADAVVAWNKIKAAPESLSVDIGGMIAKPTSLKAVLTFSDGTVTDVRSGVSFRVVDGNAAVVTEGTTLTPVAGKAGKVTVEVSGVFWGRDYSGRLEVAVVDADMIVGLRVTGPEVIDLYDVREAQFSAIGVFGDGTEAPVAADFSVEESFDGGARVTQSGLVTFNNTNQYSDVSSVTVRASYQNWSASASAQVLGWQVSLVAWTSETMLLYGGATGSVTPLKVQWRRHGVTEVPTADLTGLTIRVYGGWIRDGQSEQDEWFGYPVDKVSLAFEIPSAARGRRGSISLDVNVRSTGAAGTRDDPSWCHFALLPQEPGPLVDVTFLSPGGTPPSQTVAYEAGRPYGELPSPYRRGYYAEWTTAEGVVVTERSVCPAGGETLTARWMPWWYYVRYDSNGGSGAMESTCHFYDEAKALARNRFERADHTFAGWALTPDGEVAFRDGEQILNLFDSYEEVTLYAVWIKNGYSVILEPNGGSGEPVALMFQLGERASLPPVPFSRKGCTFAGWSRSPAGSPEFADGAEMDSLASAVGEEIRLYAVWNLPPVESVEIIGPSVIDLYDEDGGQFTVCCRRSDGGIVEVQPTWSIGNPGDSADTNACISATGFVSVIDPTAYAQPVRLLVSASCGGVSGSASVEMRGWSVDVSHWTSDSCVFWAGQRAVVRPAAIRWRRHGMLEPPTSDFTGVALRFPHYCVQEGSRQVYVEGDEVSSVQNEGVAFTVAPSYRSGGTEIGEGFISVCVYLSAKVRGYTHEGYSYSVRDDRALWCGQYLRTEPSTVVPVAFHMEGGEAADRTVAYAADIAYCSLPDVYRAGHRFDGWYTAQNGGEKVEWAMICSPLVRDLYAHWTDVGYRVSYHANGGTGDMPDSRFAVGEAHSLMRCSFVRQGYSFVGWSETAGGEVKYADGEGLGDGLTSEIGALVNLYAVWRPNRYVIRYDANGGTGTMPDLTCAYDADVPLAGNVLVRTGYAFSGWAKTADGAVAFADGETVRGLASADGQVVELFAVWTPHQYAVVFDGAGALSGSMSDLTMKYGEAATLPVCEFAKVGYHHAGWVQVPGGTVVYVAGDEVRNLTAERNGRVTMCAVWEKNTYSISYQANGGRGTMDDTACAYDEDVTLAANAFVREGHDFVGWARSAEGEKAYDDEASVKNLVAEEGGSLALFAVWRAHRYVIAFRDDGQPCGLEDLDVAYGEEVVLPTECPTSSGGALGGWQDAEGKILRAGTSVKNLADVDGAVVTLNATWRSGWDDLHGMVGVSLEYGLAEFLEGLELETGGKSSIKGQPAGVKIDAKNGKLAGVPTKAGTFSARVTDAKKNTKTVTFTVEALPAWAIGTFVGIVEGKTGRGNLTLSVGKNGKVSGKAVVDGLTWKVSAASYAMGSDVNGLEIAAEATYKKDARKLVLTVLPPPKGATLLSSSAEGSLGGAKVTLWRNVWKDKGATAAAVKLQGLYTAHLASEATGYGYLSLKVDAKGNVKTTGKLPDGTSASSPLTLVSGDGRGGEWFAVWALAPGAYKGGQVCGIVNLDGRLDGSADWTSLAPNASETYGAGFFRRLGISGAYYGTGESLRDHCTALSFASEAPELSVQVKCTDYDDRGKKVTTTEFASVKSAVTTSGLVVSVDAGDKLTAPAATKPMKDKKTGEWIYERSPDGDPTALKVSFAKATGVFKGSFLGWYDYLSAQDHTKENGEKFEHKSQKVSFEGIWVQGVGLKGFYLWDCAGAYEDPKTGKAKTFKFKQSYPVEFE